MRAWLLYLRKNGVRLPQQREHTEWIDGFVETRREWAENGTGLVYVATFRGIDQTAIAPPLGTLYNVTLTQICQDWMILRGIEEMRVNGGTAAVLQEWKLNIERDRAPGAPLR